MNDFFKKIFFGLAVFFLTGGGGAFAVELFKENAEASYYADKFHGRMTANGEIFDMNAMTCAHKTLPFNTILRVTNLSNGRTVQVRVNDRGPYVAGREIDLSKGAAIKLDMITSGTARVKIEILKKGDGKRFSSGSQKDGAGKANVASNGKGAAAVNKSAESGIHSVIGGGQLKQIQLGSFADKSYGRNYAEKVSHAGFGSVYLVKAGDVYRVVIKSVQSEDVDGLLNRLDKAGFTNHLVKVQK